MGKNIGTANQQKLLRITRTFALEHHKAGLHAPLGIAERRQTGCVKPQRGHVLSELALQKRCSVCSFSTNNAQVVQLGDASQVLLCCVRCLIGWVGSHVVNYHAWVGNF